MLLQAAAEYPGVFHSYLLLITKRSQTDNLESILWLWSSEERKFAQVQLAQNPAENFK